MSSITVAVMSRHYFIFPFREVYDKILPRDNHPTSVKIAQQLLTRLHSNHLFPLERMFKRLPFITCTSFAENNVVITLNARYYNNQYYNFKDLYISKPSVVASNDRQITAGNQSAVVSATASMDSESYPTELPESEPPAEDKKFHPKVYQSPLGRNSLAPPGFAYNPIS
ncbi:hypothetical protein HELRODRAFT_172881 [Helobdella robusta]|uniref:Uncharacterized protein n=1 Tax=Helobdella robusta TaxID=6412 RepID=T1F623_HELRO|nr:hypothetical protein HELRODRAFT_172881 [Helobdella robusta]ESO03858.1 hypothetical protein HELRODRAFT_172881 [Helobdella robusta]